MTSGIVNVITSPAASSKNAIEQNVTVETPGTTNDGRFTDTPSQTHVPSQTPSPYPPAGNQDQQAEKEVFCLCQIENEKIWPEVLISPLFCSRQYPISLALWLVLCTSMYMRLSHSARDFLSGRAACRIYGDASCWYYSASYEDSNCSRHWDKLP